MHWLSLGLIAMLLLAPAARGAPAEDPAPGAGASGGESATTTPRHDEGTPKPKPLTERPREHTHREGSRDMPMGPGIFRDVTDQDINDVLGFTQQHLPMLHEALQQMRESEPARFRGMCRRLRFEITQLKALKQTDEAAFQKALDEKRLQFLARNLADRLRAAQDPAERDRLRTQLRETVGKLFDAELATREAHIGLLGKKLDDLRAELRQRADQREAIVRNSLEEMLEPKPQDAERPGKDQRPEGPPKEPPAPKSAPKSGD